MHFYTRDGEARHTVIGKNGKERPSRVADATGQGWLPSATTILQIKANPQLTKWFQKMAAQTALSLTRNHDESMDEFIDRIIHESTQKSRTATDFGTLIHDHLEKWNRDHSYFPPPESEGLIRHICAKWRDYCAENVLSVLHAERLIACPPLGVAGTVDLICERKDTGLSIGDFKTTGGVKDGKASFWPNYAWQLALYSRMVRIQDGLSEDPRIVSHVINSQEPDEIHTKVYTQEEQQKALAMVLTLAKAWFLEKNYFPDGLDIKALDDPQYIPQ